MRLTVSCFAVMTMLGPVSLGQESGALVGKQVIIGDGGVLKVGDELVREFADLHVYRVKETNGDWLWLVDQDHGTKGWVQSRFAIPVSQAIAYFTTQIKANPGKSELYVKRGTLWRLGSKNDKAIPDLNEAIRLHSSNEMAWYSRALSWIEKNDTARAIGDANEVSRISPESGRGHFLRGCARLANDDLDAAIADFDQALQLGLRDASTYFRRGAAWRLKCKNDKAFADLNECIKLNPDYGRAYFERGRVWDAQKEYDKALADYKQMLRLDPLDRNAHIRCGRIYRLRKIYRSAIDEFDLCIRMDEKDALALSERAWIRAACPEDKYRDPAMAGLDAYMACELTEFKDPYMLAILAAAFARTEMFDKAVETQEKALKVASDEQKKSWQKRLDLYRQNRPIMGDDPNN
jgi:tetratricopeptide (TPR) repeat protein